MNLPALPTPSPVAVVGRDLIAGVVVFLVAVPLCLGIALASGAPLVAGLVSGIVGGILVGSLSGSQVSVSGPAAGLAAIVLAQISALGSFDAFLLAVVFAGALQVGLGLFKAGALANYFPTNVVKGLLAAIGVLLILKQLPHLVGFDKNPLADMAFLAPDGTNTFSQLGEALSAAVPGAALVGLISLAILILWDRTPLKKSIVPGPLVAVVAGTVLSELLASWHSRLAIEASHLVAVPVLGAGETFFSALVQTPDFSRLADPAIYAAAVTLAVVASLETLLNIEATDRLDPQRRVTPRNRELLAQGVGNMAAGMIGGLPMTSVIVRSSVNVNAGSRTKLSAIFHGLLLLGSVLLLPGMLNRIPLATLAAVLIITGFKLASPAIFRSMWREGRGQFLPFVITVLAIVLTDLLIGILIGLGVSLASILVNNIRHGVRVVNETHVSGVVHRLELGDQATFLNRAQLAELLGGFKRGDQVLIDARTCDYIDSDILAMLHEFSEETAPARGIRLSLLGFQHHYPLRDTVQYVDVSTREVQASLTPAKVLALLREGNRRFVAGERLQRDLVRQVDATAGGQHPMAAILSCIDSRAPAELLFDLGIGDIFVARLAGNVASPKALGSLEFACRIAGAKLIVVLGHTRCGAVKATCDFIARDVDPVEATGLTNLPAITEPISEAVHMEKMTVDNRDASNEIFVDRVATINVRNTIRWIQDNSPTLSEMILRGEIDIVGGMYNVSTGRVEFLDSAADAPAPGPASAVAA